MDIILVFNYGSYLLNFKNNDQLNDFFKQFNMDYMNVQGI